MRHAKSDWTASAPGEPPLPDKDRPLSRRGKRDAPLMATWMAANGLDPDLIICSTAVRTRQTLALTKKTIDCERQNIQQREDLYLARSDDLIELARSIPDDIRHLMMLGHNPGLRDAAIMLIGAGDVELRRALSSKLPTAGVVVIDFAFDQWRSISPGSGTLRIFMAPKRLVDRVGSRVTDENG